MVNGSCAPFKPARFISKLIPMTVSPARRSAFEILRRVDSESAYASVLLAGMDSRMREDDRALCHELVLGVLRRRLWLDRSIEHFAKRAIESLDLPVRLGLELGLYQLRFLSRVPPSAAVNESVNLIRAARVKSAAGFVNAVLRRATREPDYDPAANVINPIEKVAVQTSHPQWLIERWSVAFGLEEAASFGHANNQPSPTAFRLTSRALANEQTKDEIFAALTAAGGEVTPSEITPDSWRVLYRTAHGSKRVHANNHSTTPASVSALLQRLSGDGLIYLQDEASQLVAHLLKVQDKERVLDVAGAPGSKATHIATLAPGAIVIAGDVHVHRLVTMRELAAAQAARIHVLAHDAIQPLPFAEKSFDQVLLDAPCSGTGTLRRNPEIRWRLKPEDIEMLSSQQQSMLSNAASLVRPGGRLVYSTCSVEIEENEAVVNNFLQSHPDFARSRLEASSGLQSEIGEIRTWPHRQNVDGFFVAAFERKT